MLGPKFREGQALADDSRIDIPLPEDDPGAMESICNVLPFRNFQVPQKLDIDGHSAQRQVRRLHSHENIHPRLG